MTTQRLVLATGNGGKVAELQSMLAPFSVDVVAQKTLGVADVPETGTTFVENAIIKARHAAAVTGLSALADDSGLEVEALNGAPGVRSARYAGESASDADNVEMLLAALTGVDHRAAAFHCVIVFMRSAEDPTPLIASGRWAGTIAAQRSGDGGFGYDPVFQVPETGLTAAQLGKSEKNRISHRAIALQSLIQKLRATGRF
ncbi:MAG: RdgB/HAM1 family non-canonical purine NTP pyrophosphatase [Woeseiaceae bacterium]